MGLWEYYRKELILRIKLLDKINHINLQLIHTLNIHILMKEMVDRINQKIRNKFYNIN